LGHTVRIHSANSGKVVNSPAGFVPMYANA
jgi:hypothetical protein